MIEDGFNRIVELWTPILDEFDKQSVLFALEVHPTEIAYDLYTTEKLLKHFNRRQTFGINFDPSHLIWQGVEPHLFIREFHDRIYHVHMKDAAVTLDGKAGILDPISPLATRGAGISVLGHGDVNFETSFES